VSQAKHHDEQDSKREKSRRRTRVRETDYMRVENDRSFDPLSRFEQNARDKLAAEKSPLDELLAEEEEAKQLRARHIERRRLAFVLKKANLTAKLEQCFLLLYVQNFTVAQAAKILGVSNVRVRQMRIKLKTVLLKAAGYVGRNPKRGHLDRPQNMTRNQRRIWRLKHREGLPSKEIAAHLGISLRAVNMVLRRVK